MASSAVDGVDAATTAWILGSTALVLFMTPGLSLFYAGLVHRTAIVNTMIMTVSALSIVAVMWVLVGFSLAFGNGGPVIGNFEYVGLTGMEGKTWQDTGIPQYLFACYQMTFACIAAAIMVGAVVGRMHGTAFCIFIALWTVLVYCPIAHSAWGEGGWMDKWGNFDFAGGGVVHLSSASSALTLALKLGPRIQTAAAFTGGAPTNVPFVILGTGILLFGWTGFNGGSALAANQTAAIAVINTYATAAASTLAWMLIERLHLGHVTATGVCTGCVVGLVLVTPAAGYIVPLTSLALGLLGCPCSYLTFWLFERAGFDDTLNVFPCHGLPAIFGAVFTGVLARPKYGGLLQTGSFELVGKEVACSAAIFAYSCAVSAIILFVVDMFLPLRVSRYDEEAGIDFAWHGEIAYANSIMGISSRLHFRKATTNTRASATSPRLGNAGADVSERASVSSLESVCEAPSNVEQV